MKTHIRLLLFVLAVPLAASLLASAARERWDDRWSGSLRRQFGAFARRSDRAVFSAHTLAALCSDPRSAPAIPACRTYNRLSAVVNAGAGTAALGVLWLGLIAGGGRLALRRRGLLLRGFRPFLYLTAALLIVLIVAHGLLGVLALSVGSLFFAPGGGWFVYLAAIVALVVIGLAVSNAFGVALRMREAPSVLARRVPGEGDGLRQLVAVVGARLQLPGVRHLVAGLAPSLLVSPEGVECLDGRLEGPTLHYPLTLARILTVPEFEALLAAQLARLRDEDSARASAFSSSWLRLYDERARLTRAGGLRPMAAFPAASWIIALVESFAAAAAAVWRHEEAAGLQAAASIAGADVCGAAVVKLEAFEAAWGAAVEAMIDAVAGYEQYPNAAVLFQEVAASNVDPERIRVAIERAVASGGFGGACAPNLERVAAAAIDVRPAAPASALLGDVAVRLEEDLTAARHLQILHRLQ